MKRICKEQYEKDFDEMFKLDKKGLMTDIDCYVSNLENSIKRLEQENQELKKMVELYTKSLYNAELTKYKEVIDRAIKHVSSLSSKGRGCEIYADVKKDILDILKEVE